MFKRIVQRLRQIRTLSSVDAYAQWAATYPAEAHNTLMQIEQAAMRSLLPNHLTGQTVLDLACGTGRYGKIAHQRHAATVIGLDNSAAMLKVSVLGLSALATTEAIPLANNTIDTLICGMALGHLPQIEPSLAEMSRVLKPNGIALISDFHPYQALSGAQRTFTATDGTTFAVEHYIHHISDYHRTARDNNLHITYILEPTYNEKPVVLVMALQKRN